ncbi:MAG: NAD-dependent epimerase/dehydratase family protein [Actinobacteria bacterium]|nr:NAD-dependent epimerase/dehydratase family protein [Actinomycetota bacterium]
MDMVTGGTGLLGSHIVEHLVRAGKKVRALVRKGSDTKWLESQPDVELAFGHLEDKEALNKACQGIEVVYHSAAKVGDWGDWEDFEKITIDGTRLLLEAACQAKVKRFIHISSISGYGHPDGQNLTLDETSPLGQNLYRWSYYTKSKVAAEGLVRKAHAEQGLAITIIRPSWLFGERDRVTVKRVVKAIRSGTMKIIGDGTNRLNAIYAGNVAQACLLAAEKEAAIGQAYNISNNGVITQQELFDTYAKYLDCEPISKHVPFGLAYRAAFMMEVLWKLFHSKKPPLLTRYAAWLMGRKVYFSIEKAQKELGWEPEISYEEGIRRTVQWYRAQEKSEAA